MMEHAGSRSPTVRSPVFSRSIADLHPLDEPVDAADLYRRLELHQLKLAAVRLLDSQDCMPSPVKMSSTLISSSASSNHTPTGVFDSNPTSTSNSSSSSGTSGNISNVVSQSAAAHLARSVHPVCKDRDTTAKSTSSSTDLSTATRATVSLEPSLAEKRRSLSLLKNDKDPEHSMQDRRRTLQTVSELASKHSTPYTNDTIGESSRNRNDILLKNRDAIQANGNPNDPKAQKKSRHQSLGNQQGGSRTQDSVATTPPTTSKSNRRHSLNDVALERTPGNLDDQLKDESERKSKRFSLKNYLRGRSSKNVDAPTQEVTKNAKTPTLKSKQSNGDTEVPEGTQQNSSSSKGKEPVRRQGSDRRQFPNGDIYRERREWERTRREKAVLEAKAKRDREGRNLFVGSSSTLPSMSPHPPLLPKSNSGQMRGRMSQQQLFQNSRTMTGHRPATRHMVLSPPIMEAVSGDQVSAQLLKHASTSNINEDRRSNSRNLAFRKGPPPRRRSTTSESQRSSRAIMHENTIPVLAVRGSPNVLNVTGSRTSPTRPPLQTTVAGPSQERRPRSLQLQSQSQSRASSAHSAISAADTITSRGTRTSRRSPSPAASSHSRRRHRREITQEHLDALAALTAPAPRPDGGMTPESRAFFESQQKKLAEKRRRESAASERAMRISLAEQETRSRATSHTRSIYNYHPPIHASHASNGVPKMPSPAMRDGTATEDMDESTVANESIRLLREREKLVRWKAEREKGDFEKKQRDKIRERVRRANEMEEERSKAMEKQQHKKKKRGWCGSRRE